MREGPKSVILANLKARRSYLTEEMTPFGVVLDPWGVIQTPDPLIGCGLLAISSVILAPRGPGGVIQGSKMTHFGGPFWTPFLTPFELSWAKPRGQPHMGVPIPSEGVQKGVQKGVKNRSF